MRVVVCGGGVIGASIAYFLAERGVDVVVVERTGVACAASGKSGGFLAHDWCDGSPLQALARRSFALHAELAQALSGEAWGYRRLDTYAGAVPLQQAHGRRARVQGVDWLSESVMLHRRLGSTESTAQVDPAAFTHALMRAAEARGAVLHYGAVRGLRLERQGEDLTVTGVDVDGAFVGGDSVVIALGPWSILASQWLRLPGVFGLKGHSLLFDTGGRVPAQALFLEYEEADGEVLAPEVFPRRDGTTYVCAISSDSPLPVDPADVAPDPGAIERLEALCRRVSPVLEAAPIRARQACYRPVTRDGLPLVGKVPGVANAYIATGHSVWGILNAPATGEAMAELMLDGAAQTIDLAAFDPGRLRPFEPAQLRVARG